MPRKITFDTVRTLGLELPGVEEGTTYGTPALKLRGKVIACVPTNKSAEPNSLVVAMDIDQRAELLAADPGTYYLPDHYVNGPYVLVRLSRVHLDALRDLLGGAHRFMSSTRASRKPVSRRSTATRRRA